MYKKRFFVQSYYLQSYIQTSYIEQVILNEKALLLHESNVIVMELVK